MVDKHQAVSYEGPVPRPLRILYPGAADRLTNRGVARQPVFPSAADRQAFLAGGAAAHAALKPRVTVQEMGEE